jgi:putative DNA primase/helicase
MPTDRTSPELLQAALDYAMLGWPVFPCNPKDKTPYTEHGFKDASTDPTKITAWWKRWPRAMIGLATGLSNLVVMDVDANPAKNKVGLASFTALGVNMPDDQMRVRTPTGGVHFYFEALSDFPVSNSQDVVGKDIDIRANGGYVIAAPSINAAGERYERKGFRIPPVPDWLREILERERPSIAARSPEEQKATIAEVRRVLRALPNDGVSPWCDTYEKWQRVCAAIKGALGEDGLELWLEWNDGVAQGEGYEPEKKWREAGADYIGWVALRKLAERYASKEAYEGVKTAEAARHFDDGTEHPSQGEKNEGAPLDPFQRIVAQWIIAQRGSVLRWNVDIRKWAEFNGLVWREVQHKRGYELAQTWAMRVAPTLNRVDARTVLHSNFAAGVEESLRNTTAVIARASDFDADPWIFGAEGKSMDLKSGAVRKARPEDMISKQLLVAPAAKADCPLWMKFIAEVTRGDVEMAFFLQQFAGYCLTGDVSEQKFLYLYGPGGNGKSIFVEVVASILNDYAVQAMPDLFIRKPLGRGHSAEIAHLAGARLVTVCEVPHGAAWDEALLKEMTGSAYMTARVMRGNPFTFPITFKIIATGNDRPTFPGGISLGIKRRLVYGEFMYKPKVVDPDLKVKLLKEAPGILRWMIDGCLAWQKMGLVIPQSMQDAAESYFHETDPVERWLDDNIDKVEGAWTSSKDLHADWMQWCMANNCRDYQSSLLLARHLRDVKGFKNVTRQGYGGFKGLSISKQKANRNSF